MYGGMALFSVLQQKLKDIDGKGYKQYKGIQGAYTDEWFQLHIDYVQGDPFASPSRIRCVIPYEQIEFKPEWTETHHRKVAFTDYFTRKLAMELEETSKKLGSGKSGLIAVDAPGQEVIERSSIVIGNSGLDIRFTVGLPAAGRKVLGMNAIQMLCVQIPILLKKVFIGMDQHELEEHLKLADHQMIIRQYLREHGYIAFIANGSILPRESGISEKPMKREQAVPFSSPPSMEISIVLPHREEPICGMAIKKGVTVIAGGGFHGKSTLLKAIEKGIYNHRLGDGREYVITDELAVKVRAEDGRRAEKVNIRPFINDLPFDSDTSSFSTDNSSGSTSQAVNIIEALEMKAKILLIDEDTSATNFMIRDCRMQQLVSKDREPITPFIDHVRTLYEQHGISTVLVTGGSGDYLEVCDTVILMDAYHPQDATQKAKDIVQATPNRRVSDRMETIKPDQLQRRLSLKCLHIQGMKEKADAKSTHSLQYGRNYVDLSAVEQIADKSQTRAIAYIMQWISKHGKDEMTLMECISMAYEQIERYGLDAISPYKGSHPGDLALPRPLECAAAINRYRGLKIK